MAAAVESPQESLARARAIILGEGFVLIFLGAVAIVLPGLAAIAITILLGWLFFFSGIVGLLLTLGTSGAPGHHYSRLSAAVALIAGIVLIFLPVRDGRAFMDVLGFFFALDGIFSILYAIEHRGSRRWRWMLASGLFTLALAAFILARPSTSVPLLGLLVGIDLVFAGLALLAIGGGLKREA